jgi:hypothetical protein
VVGVLTEVPRHAQPCFHRQENKTFVPKGSRMIDHNDQHIEIEKRAMIRKAILKNYGNVARSSSTGCCGPLLSCCSPGPRGTDGKILGYSEEELAAAPERG